MASFLSIVIHLLFMYAVRTRESDRENYQEDCCGQGKVRKIRFCSRSAKSQGVLYQVLVFSVGYQFCISRPNQFPLLPLTECQEGERPMFCKFKNSSK